MKYSLIVISILFCFTLSAQDDVKRNIYYGNIAYHNESFDEAMLYYEKAIIESPFNYNANYNMANAYFKLEIYDKAIEKYESLLNQTNDIAKKSMLHHNIGNCNLSNQKLDDAIESYKESLRLMPNAESTRYNLAFALELKKEQEKQQQEKQEQQEGEEGDSENNSDNNQNKSDSEGEKNNQNSENQDSQEDEKDQTEEEEEEENKTDSEDENQEDEKEDNSNNDSQQKDETNKVSESRKSALKILEEANKREKEVQKMITSNKGKKNSNKKNTSSTKKDW